MQTEQVFTLIMQIALDKSEIIVKTYCVPRRQGSRSIVIMTYSEWSTGGLGGDNLD